MSGRLRTRVAWGGEVGSVVGEDDMDLVGDGGDQRGCRAYRQSSSGSKYAFGKQRRRASSPADRTVDLGSFGPVGRSETEVRAFHLATVFGLIPQRFASPLRLS